MNDSEWANDNKSLANEWAIANERANRQVISEWAIANELIIDK